MCSCCEHTCPIPEISLSQAGSVITVSGVGSKVWDNVNKKYIDIEDATGYRMRWFFYGTDPNPIWQAEINPKATASNISAWSNITGSKSWTDFTIFVVLPAITGSGLTFKIDYSAQVGLDSELRVGLMIVPAEDCVGRALKKLQSDPLNPPQIQLGGGDPFVENGDAYVIGGNTGIVRIDMLMQMVSNSQAITPGPNRFAHFQLRLDSHIGSVISQITALIGADLQQATLAASADPADLTGNEVIDQLGNFSTGSDPIKNYINSPFPIQSGTPFIFRKKDFATSMGWLDDKARKICLVAWLEVDGIVSGTTYSCMPTLAISGRLDGPGALYELTGGEVVHVDRNSQRLRTSTQGIVKTINGDNDEKYALTGDPIDLVGGEDTLYMSVLNPTSKTLLYELTLQSSGLWSKTTLYSQVQQQTFSLKRSALRINNNPVLIGGSDFGLAAYYVDGQGNWSHVSFSIAGYTRGMVVDTDGDIYVIAFNIPAGSVNMYRVLLSDNSGIPQFTVTVVGSFTYNADVDGLSGSGGISEMGNMAIGPAVNAHSSFYITDRDNHKIRQLSLTSGKDETVDTDAFGVVSVWGGVQGYVDGLQASARLNGPDDILALGSSVYMISDGDNHVLRRWDRIAGTVSTFIGDGTRGNIDSIVY